MKRKRDYAKSGEGLNTMRKQIEVEAIEALRDTLQQVSVIKVKEITKGTKGSRRENLILAHIEIYGHAHLLACKVVESYNSSKIMGIVDGLKAVQKKRGVVTIPVLISRVMSEESQSLCRDNNLGFLDLAGNARLYLDEVFIVKRSLPHNPKLPPKAEKLPISETTHFAHVA